MFRFLNICNFLEFSVLWGIIGAGFSSKSKYMYGKVSVEIKLVEGDSAGTVTAFYVSFNCPFHPIHFQDFVSQMPFNTSYWILDLQNS